MERMTSANTENEETYQEKTSKTKDLKEKKKDCDSEKQKLLETNREKDGQ